MEMIEAPGSAAKLLDAAIRVRLGRQQPGRPLVVGICGSQGSGKSTACEYVAHQLSSSGIRVAVLSIDDLYLPKNARQALAERVHPLLVTRGVPGTHDTSLGVEVLQALGRPGRVNLPRVDKALDDRRPESQWDGVDAPVDLILFEGWCVGARPQSPHLLEEPVNALEAQEDSDGRWRRFVNDALAHEYQRLFSPIDFLVLLAAPTFEVVVRWRTQQEHDLRSTRTGAAGVMSDSAIERFVQHYERLTRHILAEMPARADLVLRLDENRRVIV
jgi:D-glycerate 3-kinase